MLERALSKLIPIRLEQVVCHVAQDGLCTQPATCGLLSTGHIGKVLHLYLTIAQLGFTQHASGQADGIQQHDGRAIKCFVGSEALSQGCALATGGVIEPHDQPIIAARQIGA